MLAPAMLKLYPVGSTNATVSRGTPNATISSIARGKVASELAVANPSVTGSTLAFTNFFNGIRAHHRIGSTTNTMNTANAMYRVAISFSNGTSTASPMCPTVYATAPKIPIGAAYITMLVNLNIVSDKLSANVSIGCRFASGTSSNPIANNTLNTTTCNTCPSATLLAIFSGKMSVIICVAVCGETFSDSGVDPAGRCTLSPALLMLIAANPINSAIVDTTSKYTRDFQPSRPTFFRFACPAIPVTRIPNSSGAMITLISRRKIFPRNCSLAANAGASYPSSAPANSPTKIHAVNDRRTVASAANNAIATQRSAE